VAHSTSTNQKNQVLLPSLSTYPLAPSIQKKSVPGAGDVFLTRGKQEVEAPVQGEVMVHQEVVAGTL
jgi:hypothetical protein